MSPISKKFSAGSWTGRSAGGDPPMSLPVGYLGPEGTFTHQAVLGDPRLAGRPAVPLPTVEAVLGAVARAAVDVGVVPWESSVAGLVGTTADTMAGLTGTPAGGDLLLERDLVLAVRMSLFGRRGARPDALTTVASHPHALDQCRGWLTRHAPGAAQWSTPSTATALELVAADPAGTTAAIAPAASHPAGPVVALATGIGDVPDAETRFVVVGRRPATFPRPAVPHQPAPGISQVGIPEVGIPEAADGPPAACARIVLACFPPDGRLDRLWDVLVPFAERGVNLLRFESRPTRTGLGACYFLLECVGDAAAPLMTSALYALRARDVGVTLLGVLPRHPHRVSPPQLIMESA